MYPFDDDLKTTGSVYARFHAKYLGYCFRNLHTDLRYRKSELYYEHPEYINDLLEVQDDDVRHGARITINYSTFVLFNSPNWKDGQCQLKFQEH